MDQTCGSPSTTSLSDIDITHQLHIRQSRVANYKQENEALILLAEMLAEQPGEIAQGLADAAMKLTGASSAGLSLEEHSQGQCIFRWVATAGELSRYVNGTMPRQFSPCGEVLDRNQALLIQAPVRYYQYISELHTVLEEVLLVPFHSKGVPIGTVWIVSHNKTKKFDSEDLRLINSIAKFAATAMQTVGLVKRLQDANEHNEVAMASLKKDDERKDNFLAILAHEMRTPLSAITMGVEALQLRQSAQYDNRPILQSIARQTGQLLSLIKDMTDISSIKAGKFTLHQERLVAQELIASAVESCIAQSERYQHTLEVEAPDEPIELQGDAVRLTQVLVNLLNNATKYTPAHGKITLKVHVQNNRVLFSVTDTGIGIPEHMLGRIFDMFMQDEVTDRKAYSGLGIGLSLVQQFVQLHNGTVTAHSAGENKGSKFTVSLPLRGAHHQQHISG